MPASRSRQSAAPLRATFLALAVVGSLLAFCTPAGATPSQLNFVQQDVFSGLTQPTDIRFASDGRAFVAEKSGLIKVFDNLNDTSASVVADLRTNVHNFWDRGLLGMALHPQFPQQPYIYVLYAHDAAIGGTAPRFGTPGATSDPCPTPPGPTADGCVVSGRLSRLQISGNVAVGGEQVLIEDWCQQYPSHSIGGLAFGPDGALYVTGGDGASFNFTDYGQDGSPLNPCGDPPVPVGGVQSPPSAQGGALRSQDLRTLLDPTSLDGSVLRVDPNTGAGLPDNPLAASSDPNARRIVATGLRNPFRLTFRPGTSELWVGDVGWSSREEINRVESPADGSVDNFGWPCHEGPNRQGGYDGADLTICEDLYGQPSATKQPFFSYQHGTPVVSGDNCSTGGSSTAGLAFYEGGGYPAAYDQALFFADYSRSCVWVMFPQGGLPAPATRVPFAGQVAPVNLRIGPGGDLFIVDFGGVIRRISYQSTNRPPTAVAQASPTSGQTPLTVNFDGRGSSDPDAGDTLSYAWDLDGDGIHDDSTSAQPSWTYTAPGAVTARLRVTDPEGEFDTDSVVINPGSDPPQATIATPGASLRWKVGDNITFRGSATDPQDGPLPASRLTWSLSLHHCTTTTDCHVHPVNSWDGISEGSFVAPDHGYPAHLELTLTARDSVGQTDTETVRLDPSTVDLTFRTQPAGLRLAVGSEEGVTPFTRQVIVGSTNSISAPTPQSLGGTGYEFSSWSDGGARAHEIVAPASATTYTANYQATTPPGPSGLVGAWGFGEGSGSSVGDASPEGNGGTVSGAAWSAAGRYGSALSFDGVNDWVTVADDASLDLAGAFTLEAWVRPTTAAGIRTVLLKERPPGEHAYALYSALWGPPQSEIFTSTGFFSAAGTASAAAGVWTHLAATLGGGSLRLYVNGTLVRTSSASGAVLNTGAPLRIGGNAIWDEWFGGLIDEVRVYNRALSAAEIQTDLATAIAADTTPPSAPPNLTAAGATSRVTLDWDAATDNVGVQSYNVHRGASAGFTPGAGNRIAVVNSGTDYVDSGLAAGDYFYRVSAADGAGNVGPPSNEARGTVTGDTQPPAVSLTAPAAGATVSGAVDVRANASDNSGVAGVQFLLDGQPLGAEDTSAPYERSWDTRGVANGAHQLSARARDEAGNQRTSATVNVTVTNAPGPSGLVGAWGFGEGSGSSVGDASPEGNGGTVSGAAWSAAGRYGSALSFDGVNDWVTVADDASLDLAGAFTLEAWVRPTTAAGIRTVLLKERPPGEHAYALYSALWGPPQSEIFTSTGFFSAAGTASAAAGVWTHLAATLGGGSLRLYVNGTLVRTSSASGAVLNTGAPLRIGGNAIWDEWFGGLIDEVRVYNRALSAAEIQTDLATAIAP